MKMKMNLLMTVFLVLSTNLSCSLFFPDKYMLDQNNLEEAFALVKSKGFGKEGLVEIGITADKVFFDTGTQRIAYVRGFTREVKSESSISMKKFQLDDIDISNFYKIITAASELARKNPYIKNPEISRVIINKQKVNRDDNLVSNVGKQRDAIRCEVYVSSSNAGAQYTTNLQGDIVDVSATNAKPQPNFLDASQMQKSVAEIKLLFGGKLSVASFKIQRGDFFFTAYDPKNTEEINDFYFNTQEFLQAGTSRFQKTLEDKKRDEAMRRGGTPEETIQMRYIQTIFFDVEEIDFSLIPQVMQKTLEAAKASNSKVSTISIRKRQDQFTKVVTLEWRVETYGDRSEKETTIFDGKGNLKSDEK
ncbi:MAG: hypothetical protein LH614_16525 [Pyrinomonadaceae bacterium]|nr:hypothetical protein [Pyrinomonadaceae bacterium]